MSDPYEPRRTPRSTGGGGSRGTPPRSSGGSHGTPSRPAERRAAEEEREQRHTVPRRRSRRPILLTLLIRVFQLIGTLILIGAVTGTFMVCYAALYVKNVVMPKTTLDLSAYTFPENSVIYYEDKDTGLYVELITLMGEMNTEWVSIDDIPEDLINAAVAIEDKRFWNHQGVDWKRTGGAVINMFFSMRDNFGGSTLTQQLIKNVTQYDDVTVTRKIQEIFTALELEKHYNKKEILEIYLNRIYLGSGCYGVQSASRKYFGKDVSELSLAECASLAGITNSPSLYSPNSDIRVSRFKCKECGKYTNDNTKPRECEKCGAVNSFGAQEIWTAKDYNKARQKTILHEMLTGDPEEGIEPTITQREYDTAVAAPLVFEDAYAVDTGDEETESRYSWYVEAVLAEVKKDLKARTGLDDRTVNQLVYSGGLSIYCCLDPEVQAAVDEVYGDPDALDGKTTDDGLPIMSAITVVDNSSGYVVAMAGDIGPKSGDLIYNYATLPRQPGSSIKPLSTYGPALEMELIKPSTVIDDNPILHDGNAWPRNEGNPYRGLTTIQYGVDQSLNTIAVRTLQMVTPELSFKFLTERFGFTTLVDGRINKRGEFETDILLPPLALGGLTEGISTFEAAAAYASFPRGGIYTEPTTYLKVEDRNHELLIDNTPRTERILKERTAWYMNQMLTHVNTNGSGYYAQIKGMTTAGKTGTTSYSYDRWFSGYTPLYTASVWVGFRYNHEIPERFSFRGSPAVHMWHEVMARIHEEKEDPGFPQPDWIEPVTCRICIDCGMLADVGCEHDSRGARVQTFTFVAGDEPIDVCTCHVPVEVCKDCPVTDANGVATGFYRLAGPTCPETSRETIYYVNFERELVTEPDVIGDFRALLSTFDYFTGGASCTVHSGAAVTPEPAPDPSDPWVDWPWPSDSPWPSDYPWNSQDPAGSDPLVPGGSETPPPTPDPIPVTTVSPEPVFPSGPVV